MKGKPGTGRNRRIVIGHVRETTATLATSADLLLEAGHSEGEADLIFGQLPDVFMQV